METLVEGEGTVVVELLDAEGNSVARSEGAKASLHLDAPHLWNGVKDPYLYTCVVRLMQDGKPVDEVTTKVGLRSFSVDARRAFSSTASLIRFTAFPAIRTARVWAMPSPTRCTTRIWR